MKPTAAAPDQVNSQLLKAAIRFNALILGLIGATLAALAIYLSTRISIMMWGADAGSYLGLLAVYFPGYSVTDEGVWLGVFWAFMYTGIFCSLSYWLYGQFLGVRISEPGAADDSGNPVIKPAILRLNGVGLGLAFGTTISLGLFLATAWLVIRGTADESVHAALLWNYIPGYSVSIVGGLQGALVLFAFVFVACLLVASLYNKIVDIRH